jgi:lantibiotic modifying enzyme
MWRALLGGTEADRALGVVEEIAANLSSFLSSRHRANLESSLSLASGLAGASLFFAYLHQTMPGKAYDDKAIELLDQAVRGLNDSRSGPTLYHGFPGVAWVLEHLQGRIMDDEEDPGEEIAAVVGRLVSQWPSTNSFDLTDGLVGLGVYALERFPRPGMEACLQSIVDQLGTMAHRQQGTATWWTPPAALSESSDELQHGHFNLGLAHGTPGVIAFLAEASTAGLDVRPLLDEAIPWVLDQKLAGSSSSVFPMYVTSRGTFAESRLGWCYGDAGIALALLKAARSVEEPLWEDAAIALAKKAALRRSPEDTQVVDATICHGTAGLAQLFNRLYQACGDPVFAETARYWVERTLDFRKAGEGVGGFLAWDMDETREMGWRANPGFLMGSAGIGLALLATATEVEPSWDRLLLASLPPSAA